MKKKEILFGSILAILTCVFVLCLVELTLRVKHHKFALTNFVEENWNLATWEFPIQHDTKLGWIPKERYTTSSKDSKVTLTILNKGIRANGPDTFRRSNNKERVLAVGASTVFGSQVSDNETWPALLEKEANQEVLNGGVFAYGLDQVILRLDQLIPELRPSRVILGIHPDNFNQVTMSQKYGKKPYFEVVGNTLVLRNTPVPPTKKELTSYQKTMGYSYLAHYLLSKLSPQFWLESHGEIKVHNQEREVSCLLLKEYSRLCAANKMKCSILFQYFKTTVPEARNKVLALNSCIDKSSVKIWDTYQPLETVKANNPILYDSFFDFHMTPKGNAWVASYIKDRINTENETSSPHL